MMLRVLTPGNLNIILVKYKHIPLTPFIFFCRVTAFFPVVLTPFPKTPQVVFTATSLPLWSHPRTCRALQALCQLKTQTGPRGRFRYWLPKDLSPFFDAVLRCGGKRPGMVLGSSLPLTVLLENLIEPAEFCCCPPFPLSGMYRQLHYR